MRTLLIAGVDPVPPRLRELIDRGSTSVREQGSADAAGSLSGDFDRVVFWMPRRDEALQSLVRRYAQKEEDERREVIVFVSPDRPDPAIAGLGPNEVYAWPADEDRLEITFLTGA